MELKLLRSFIQLIDTGHYGKASAKLFVTQSTLSKQIQALESAVGGPLFERPSRRQADAAGTAVAAGSTRAAAPER